MPTQTETPTEAAPGAAWQHRAPRRGWVRRLAGGVALSLALLVLVAGVAAASTHYVALGLPLPAWTADVGAAAVTAVLCCLLAYRVGAHTLAATVFGMGAPAAALLTGWTWLLAGVVALTAFAAAVLAVLATRPARGALRVVREYAVAIGLALAGAVSAGAYDAPMRPVMLGHVVLLSALVATLWVAHRLAGGLSGLGKRGALVIVSALVVLVVGLAYGEALRRWGGPGVTEAVMTARRGLVDLLGAVPRPLEVMVGFPALVWGLATRSSLRQGWWVCAFGALATSGVATSLTGVGFAPRQELLSTLYSALVGLALGFVVWWVDRLLTGPRGRRARRVDRARPLRPEPPRTRPLL